MIAKRNCRNQVKAIEWAKRTKSQSGQGNVLNIEEGENMS